VALTRRVFERGGDVAGFQQRVIAENFLAARPGGEQGEHVLDADAQAAQAGTASALVRIDPYAVEFAHRRLRDAFTLSASSPQHAPRGCAQGPGAGGEREKGSPPAPPAAIDLARAARL